MSRMVRATSMLVRSRADVDESLSRAGVSYPARLQHE
jgi:hypothetical protein